MEIPDALPDWRVAVVSAEEWRISPLRRRLPGGPPPSLMEDAIILSGIHARLGKLASLRSTTWKARSNAGKVVLQCATLTPEQALTALRAIAALENVAEIRLITHLR